MNIKFDKCNLISTLIKEAEHNGLTTTKYIFKRNTVLFLPICVKGLCIFFKYELSTFGMIKCSKVFLKKYSEFKKKILSKM